MLKLLGAFLILFVGSTLILVFWPNLVPFTQKTNNIQTQGTTEIQEPPSSTFSKEDVKEVIDHINDQRGSAGLKPLIIDERLCGYANKRAIEFKEAKIASNLPNAKSELEDRANKAAYFSNYSFIVVKDIGTAEDNLEKIALKFTTNTEATAMKPTLTNACFAGLESTDTKTWLTVFVGGTKK